MSELAYEGVTTAVVEVPSPGTTQRRGVSLKVVLQPDPAGQGKETPPKVEVMFAGYVGEYASRHVLPGRWVKVLVESQNGCLQVNAFAVAGSDGQVIASYNLRLGVGITV